MPKYNKYMNKTYNPHSVLTARAVTAAGGVSCSTTVGTKPGSNFMLPCLRESWSWPFHTKLSLSLTMLTEWL